MKTTFTPTPAPSYWGSPEADAAAERICDRREIAAATALEDLESMDESKLEYCYENGISIEDASL